MQVTWRAAAGTPPVWGVPKAHKACRNASWQALRTSAVAPWIGLAAPGVLLRLPYGPGRDAVEGFAFDELGMGVPASRLLWAPAGLACTLLIGRAAAQKDDDLASGGGGEIDELPACVIEQDGEKVLKPLHLTDREVDDLIAFLETLSDPGPAWTPRPRGPC